MIRLGEAHAAPRSISSRLDGPNRTTLFLLAAEWRSVEHVDEAVAARTGQILITKAPAPGAGLP